MNKVLYEGKSKIILECPDNKCVLVRFKDTATAFDGKKKEELSGKGRLNLEISEIIYRYLEENGIETHFIERIDDNTQLVKNADIVKVEVIVRNVAAGGFSKKYGVPEGTALKNPTTEFCLKDDSLGDPMIDNSQITALGIATADELDFMIEQALKINELLCILFEKGGIRLIDYKLEFGRYENRLILCDEISPDSCRLWDMNTDEKLDKDRFRRDLGDVLGGYKEVLRRIGG